MRQLYTLSVESRKNQGEGTSTSKTSTVSCLLSTINWQVLWERSPRIMTTWGERLPKGKG